MPPRSVPNPQQPGNESQLTIHQSRPTTDREPAMDSVAAPSDPFGLHNGGGASLASATAPAAASNQPPVAANGGHSIYLSPVPTAPPIEVAQAPATLDPPPGASPLQIPPQQSPPQNIPEASVLQPNQPPSNGAAAGRRWSHNFTDGQSTRQSPRHDDWQSAARRSRSQRGCQRQRKFDDRRQRSGADRRAARSIPTQNTSKARNRRS